MNRQHPRGRNLAGTTRAIAATALPAAAGVAGLGYYLAVTGKLTADTGWGRRVRPLGPFSIDVAAPAGTVFDVIAAPYLGHTLRAMAGKLRVLERATDMVPAEHYTPVHGGRLTATTVETVTFDRPHRVAFRLVRGPVRSSPSAAAAAPPRSATPGSWAPTSVPPGSGGPARWPPPGSRRSAPLLPASRTRPSAVAGTTAAECWPGAGQGSRGLAAVRAREAVWPAPNR